MLVLESDFFCNINVTNHGNFFQRQKCKDEKKYIKESVNSSSSPNVFIVSIKLKVKENPRTMKTATLLAFLLLGLACTYGKSLKSPTSAPVSSHESLF